MTATIENAKKLYEDGQYLESMQMCTELMEKGESPKEIWLLSAKCIMVNVPTPQSEKELKEVADSVIRAINETKDVEEAFEVWLDFHTSFTLWEKKMVIRALAEFEAEPTREKFDNYTRLFLPIFTALSTVMLPAKNQSIMPQLASEAGLTLAEAVKKYESGKEKANYCDDVVRDQLEYDTACRVMAKTIAKFEQSKNVTRANAQAVQMPIGTAVVLTTILYKPFGDKARKGIADDVRFERIQAWTQWRRFLLEAKFNVEGTPMNMYTGEEKDLQELRQAYAEMKALKPGFEIPAMPELSKPAQQKKSGCYVATAVYGSYDCPQVWTLRRYRDDILAQTWYGRAFIRTYYAVSPTLVKWFGDSAWFKKMWQGKLDRMVSRLQADGIADTPYQDKNW